MNALGERGMAPVVKRIVVKCSLDDAFRYFTADFEKWWPAHTRSVIAMTTGGALGPDACQGRWMMADGTGAARDRYDNGWQLVFIGAYSDYVEAQRRDAARPAADVSD